MNRTHDKRLQLKEALIKRQKRTSLPQSEPSRAPARPGRPLLPAGEGMGMRALTLCPLPRGEGKQVRVSFPVGIGVSSIKDLRLCTPTPTLPLQGGGGLNQWFLNVLAAILAAIGLTAPSLIFAEDLAEEVKQLSRTESEIEVGAGTVSGDSSSSATTADWEKPAATASPICGSSTVARTARAISRSPAATWDWTRAPSRSKPARRATTACAWSMTSCRSCTAIPTRRRSSAPARPTSLYPAAGCAAPPPPS